MQIRTFGQAATQVERQLFEAIGRGESVGVETVLSTDKYRKVADEVRRRGSLFNLIYITVASPSIAVQRIAVRVARCGHDVPADKIADHFYRSHANLTWFAAQSSHFWVIDHSGSDPTIPPVMRAYGTHGRLEYLDPNSPEALAAALAALPQA